MNKSEKTKAHTKLISVFFTEDSLSRAESIQLPEDMLEENLLTVRQEYRGREFETFYVSPCGNIFRSRAAWSDYCCD